MSTAPSIASPASSAGAVVIALDRPSIAEADDQRAASAESPPESLQEKLRTDTLAGSVMILLVMTVVQRLLGFGRGVLVCRWLDPEQLGQWDVAFGFLMLAAPLSVLGLPGSFGRYVEYYRQRGQLRTFLRRTTIFSALAGTVAVAVIAVARDWFSQLIFGQADQGELVVWVAACLATVILYNFLIALFIAVRLYRVVTALQFTQSLGFVLFSIGLLLGWRMDATSIVVAYGAACVVSCCGAVAWARRVWQGAEPPLERLGLRTFWAKLIPFAIWVWVTNLLANLFEVVDRYMIVHHSGLAPDEALRQIGCYHSSRLVPVVFVAIAALLGSVITPHLSCDWESGRHESVVKRLNLVQKSLALALFAGSIAVLIGAPLLFEVGFQGKFAGGLAVLPWTLASCAWFGLIAVAQNYLWCAEKARLSSLGLFAGVIANVALNVVLLPRFGLIGAVWATAFGNLLALALIYFFSQLHGCRMDSGTWLTTLALASLGFGPWAAAGVLGLLLPVAAWTPWLLNLEEKRQIAEGLLRQARKLGLKRKLVFR